VFIGGCLVVDNGKVTTIDRETVLLEIADILKGPETQTETQAWNAIGALLPHLEVHHRKFTPTSAQRAYRYNSMPDNQDCE
jgi:hypothetical protein